MGRSQSQQNSYKPCLSLKAIALNAIVIFTYKKTLGHKGTCIKDTWTKPKGLGLRVGGGDGWGGKEETPW